MHEKFNDLEDQCNRNRTKYNIMHLRTNMSLWELEMMEENKNLDVLSNPKMTMSHLCHIAMKKGKHNPKMYQARDFSAEVK